LNIHFEPVADDINICSGDIIRCGGRVRIAVIDSLRPGYEHAPDLRRPP